MIYENEIDYTQWFFTEVVLVANEKRKQNPKMTWEEHYLTTWNHFVDFFKSKNPDISNEALDEIGDLFDKAMALRDVWNLKIESNKTESQGQKAK